MDVSIILVNYKTKDLTINAIKSVIEKTQGINFEIFVVDNNSKDGSIEAIEKEFPNINIIKNPINAGFGAANNLAINQAKGKYILCLNTDTLLINNAIKIMYNFMEKEENKVNFDLSILSLKELIEVYDEIDKFIKYLSDKKIDEKVG